MKHPPPGDPSTEGLDRWATVADSGLMTHTPNTHTAEAVYADALELIAVGETRQTTFETLGDKYGIRLTVAAIDAQMVDALKDALAQGVEREDIDPSWFRGAA